MRRVLVVLPTFCILVGSGMVRADVTYNFAAISGNSTVNVQAQLSVVVSAVGTTQVGFKFFNDVDSGTSSSLSDVYFDDGALFDLASIAESDGAGTDVDFAQLSSGSFPEGGSLSPAFETSTGPGGMMDLFAADNENGIARGVDATSEWVQVIFDLETGKTFSDVITALNLGFALGAGDDPDDPPSLRIGVHVQGLPLNDPQDPDGASDSFIAIPAPGAGLLALLGFPLVAWLRRCLS